MYCPLASFLRRNRLSKNHVFKSPLVKRKPESRPLRNLTARGAKPNQTELSKGVLKHNRQPEEEISCPKVSDDIHKMSKFYIPTSLLCQASIF